MHIIEYVAFMSNTEIMKDGSRNRCGFIIADGNPIGKFSWVTPKPDEYDHDKHDKTIYKQHIVIDYAECYRYPELEVVFKTARFEMRPINWHSYVLPIEVTEEEKLDLIQDLQLLSIEI